MRDVNPTAPGFWQRVAKKVPGSKTAAECHDKYMSLFGDTPAPKAAKARTAKPSAKLAAGKATILSGTRVHNLFKPIWDIWLLHMVKQSCSIGNGPFRLVAEQHQALHICFACVANF